MEWTLVLAALLAVGVAIAHSYLGERYILIRLFRRDNLPKIGGSDWFTKRTLRFAWHLTSVAWVGLAATLFVEPRVAVSAAFGIHSVVVLAASRGRHYAWIPLRRDRVALVALVSRATPRGASLLGL